MTDYPAYTAAPRNALLIWQDGHNIFIELRDKDNRPIPIRYPLTTSGLQSALGIIKTQKFDTVDISYSHNTNFRAGTPAQRMNAHAILKRLGML